MKNTNFPQTEKEQITTQFEKDMQVAQSDETASAVYVKVMTDRDCNRVHEALAFFIDNLVLLPLEPVEIEELKRLKLLKDAFLI